MSSIKKKKKKKKKKKDRDRGKGSDGVGLVGRIGAGRGGREKM